LVLVLVITPCLAGCVVGCQQSVAGRTGQGSGESRTVVAVGGVDGLAEGLDESFVKLLDVLERFAQRFRWPPSPLQRLTKLTAPQLCPCLLSD
jgi:hypothetical protein